LNVFWHAKGLEVWSNIYEKMAHLEKPSADKGSVLGTASAPHTDASDADEAE